jgi:hypothetical protein
MQADRCPVAGLPMSLLRKDGVTELKWDIHVIREERGRGGGGGSLKAEDFDPAEDEQAKCKKAVKRSADRDNSMQQVVRVS